ncbi:hypothetical protein G4Y73_03810 [Wenzhouxiangella sp. XN201]|uniref:hypothetical protein n=1 Tax=Wenzhouxiangella sp. XN201 TaxID=2710755 RepID=UPI0013C7FBA2|nr:hypothetical protein [Wenzhouxiangella sp. XN201]NEZ03272.1 hypothetical protein [Wenzhouxiangella sp. XN201]
MIRKIAVFGVCALLLAGCGRDEADSTSTGEAGSSAAGAASHALFDRIDADTAWLIANTEQLPENLSELLWAPMASMAEFNRETYNGVADELDETPAAAALLRELAQIDSREALAERGIEPNGRWAVHAVSLFPFVTWQLSDAEAFQATIDRVIGEAEVEPEWRDIDDARVLWIGLGDVGVAVSHDDRYVTAAIIPDNLALMRRVANLDQPARAFDPADLEQFSEERGYMPYGSGFVDFAHVVNLLLDEDDEMLQTARESENLAEMAADPVCRAEFNALVETFPRLSLGYTEMNESTMAFDVTVETEASFAKRMGAIADTPISLDKGEPGLLDLGLALNIVGTRDFARELVAGWVNNPPQCRAFASIGEKAQEWQQALNQPIPPVVTNFQGLRVSLNDFEISESLELESAQGTLALFMRNPQMMLGMAQMFSPDLAALDLTPGGEPQPVPEGVIPNLPAGIPAFIGLGDGALGIAVGESQRERLGEAMEPGEGGGAILRYGIDFSAYAELMGRVMTTLESEFEEMEQDEAFSNPSAGMEAIAEFYDYTSVSLHLTDRGIEFRSAVTLKD